MVLLWILVSFIVFSIIVLLHEYGHYKTAKFFGIHVEEFGLGIPPRAKKLWKNKDGTLFSLNWIPLGGFVKISGESEVFLEYRNEKWKKLDKKSLLKKCKDHDDIFTKDWIKISKLERKYLKAYLENDIKWTNFYEKNIFKKSAVLLAGVVMNFILAICIFSALFATWVKPVGINTIIPTQTQSKLIPTVEKAINEWIILEGKWTILTPLENSIAQKAGIQNGDILISINGMKFESIEDIQKYISDYKNHEIHLYVERKICEKKDDCKNKKIDIYVVTSPEGTVGTYLSPNYQINYDFTYKYSFIEALKYGTLETYYQSMLTLSWLKILLVNIITPESPEERERALEQVAGPIWIVGVITNSLAGGFVLILVLSAIISVNLWVFNLLPIPALDGGRLLLLWIRTWIDRLIWKNGFSVRLENMTHIIFFLLLIALSILIAYNDIIKMFS